MYFNDLLLKKEIDPRQVLVLRHRPSEPKLNRVFSRVAAERPDIFNAYQQTQTIRVEGAMKRARFVASFIGHEPRKALFVGLYSVAGSKPVTYEEYWQVPAYIEMREKYGLKGWSKEEKRSSVLWFDLELTDFYASWKGKLVIEWPPPELSWWRLVLLGHKDTDDSRPRQAAVS